MSHSTSIRSNSNTSWRMQSVICTAGGLIGAGAVESRVDDALGALSGHAFVTLAHVICSMFRSRGWRRPWCSRILASGQRQGSMEMAFTPTRVELDDIVLEGDVLGVRESGEINYDGGINSFNAGPLSGCR